MRPVPAAFLASFLALGVALAGCSGAPSPAPASADDVVADPASDLGVVRGVVVDAAVRPLDALVTLLPLGRNATTVDGAFAFADVPPGSYLLSAQAPGHLGSQVTTSVVPGAASEVRLQLAAIPDDEPYPVTVEFEGFVQASTGILGATVQPLDPTGTTACKCTFEAIPEPGLSRLVLEASWQDWMADPTGPTEFIWLVEAVGGNATAQGTGAAPIHRVLGPLDFPAPGFRLGNATSFRVTLYPDAVWPAVGQQYQAFLTLWYRGPPPEGWAIIQDA